MARTHQSKIKNSGTIDDPTEFSDIDWYMEHTRYEDIVDITHQPSHNCDDVACGMDHMRLLD